MAKNRMVNTRMWCDNYFIELDPIEKLLFLYFLTNDKTNISGIYELPLRLSAAETGIDRDMILKILKRFENDNKILYMNGWIAIKNFVKHQYNKSKDVQKGIDREMEQAPIKLVSWVKETLYRPSIEGPPTKPNLTKPNLTKRDTECKEVLDYLNIKCNKNYQYNDSNVKYIRARFKNGATIEQLKYVIDVKLKDKYFIDNNKYYRPSTLFTKDHFSDYLNETIEQPQQQHCQNHKPPPFDTYLEKP